MLSKYKFKTKNIAEKISTPFLFLNPNLISFIGLLFSLTIFFLIYYGYFCTALILFPFLFFDFIDGTVARMRKIETNFGAVLDSTLDRFSDGLIISAFGFSGIVRWEWVVVLLLLSFGISYIRSRAELASGGKLKLNIGFLERTERLVGLFIILFLYVMLPYVEICKLNISEIAFLLLIFLSIVTLIQRFIVSYKNL